MAKREKSLSYSFLLNSVRTVKTSYKHTRNITMQPIKAKINYRDNNITKNIEEFNNQFFKSLNDSTNTLNDQIYDLIKIRTITNDYKSNQLIKLRNDLRMLRKTKLNL